MTFKELVLKNRSYRGYDASCAVSKEELLELVDLSRFAPSAMNLQELKFCVVCDKETAGKLVKLSKWAARLKEKKLPYPGKEPSGFIVICRDKDLSPSLELSLIDAGIAAQTILLGAVEKGLGGCINASFNKEELSALLALPQNAEPLLLLAVGKPDEKIVLTRAEPGGDVAYWRDESDVHYVPKRALKDIVLS